MWRSDACPMPSRGGARLWSPQPRAGSTMANLAGNSSTPNSSTENFSAWRLKSLGRGVGGKAVTHLVGWGRRPSSQGLSSINLSSWLYLKSLLTQFLFLFLEQHYPSPYHPNLESESSLTIHTSRTSPIYPPALHFHCSCFSSVVHHGSTRPSL